jgi:hypothetical protein
MAPKATGIKTSKLFQKKHKAKTIEWMPHKRSQGIIYTQVEVGTSTLASMSQQTAERDAVRMEIDNHKAAFNRDAPTPMDVDETFWIDELDLELDVPDQTQRRVSLLTCLSLMPFDIALSLSTPSWKSLFLGLSHT